MRRREFITLLGSAAAMWPLAAGAQRAGKIYHIGVLETTPLALNAPNFDALRSGLRDLGYVEGQNLIIVYRSADGRAHCDDKNNPKFNAFASSAFQRFFSKPNDS
jgi:putative ABC transport system substrate-binding protein